MISPITYDISFSKSLIKLMCNKLNFLRSTLPLVALSIILGCSSNKSENPSSVIKTSDSEFEQGLNDYIKSTPLTNRDTSNNEWKGNVYRNKFYRFRIEFPKGWEYDNGSTKITLGRSLNRNIAATISVFVSHIAPQEKPSNPDNIVSSVPLNSYLRDFNKSMALQNTKAENLETEIGFLNNFPAYMISFITNQSSGTKSFKFLSKQIQCYQNGLMYQIALNVPLDNYSSDLELQYKRTIESFNFENAY